MNLSSVWRRLFVNWHHGEEIVVYGAIDWIRACVDFGTTAPARRKGCGALGAVFYTPQAMLQQKRCMGTQSVLVCLWCFALVLELCGSRLEAYSMGKRDHIFACKGYNPLWLEGMYPR
jgi:hypothetical protein